MARTVTISGHGHHEPAKVGNLLGSPRFRGHSDVLSLTKRRLTLREIFSSTIVFLVREKVKSVLTCATILVIMDDRRVQLAA